MAAALPWRRRETKKIANYRGLSFTTEVVQQLVVPTFVLDAEGKVIVWNKACETLTGMASGEVLGTRNHWRAFYGIERPCLADLMVEDRLEEIDHYYPIYHQSLEVAQGVHTENWCVMPLRGNQLYLEIDAGPIRDEEGNIVAVVETLRDMTLRQSAESRLRTMFECSPDPVWIIEDGRFVECNDSAIHTLGYASKDQFLNTHPSQLSPPVQPDGEDSYSKAERMMALARDKGLHRFEWIHTRADGSTFTAEVTLSVIDLAGRQAIYCAWRDISDRKRAEDALRLYAKVFENSGEAILITDRSNRIIAVNQALERDSGYCPEELLGKDPRVLSAHKTPRETYQLMWAALRESGYWQGELWDLRKDGMIYPKWAAISAIHDAKGELTNYIASFTDISERKAAEARIDHLAHHDALTGLFNRYSLENRLAQSLLAARRENQQLAVIFIDLDRFKVINDLLGHAAGDGLLVAAAQRLRRAVGSETLLARFGGDEFMAVIAPCRDEQVPRDMALRITDAFAEPFPHSGEEFSITASVGIAQYPQDGATIQQLINHADAAMFDAKRRGRNNWQAFTPALSRKLTDRLLVETQLRRALDNQEFYLRYQPQVDLVSGKVTAAEALIRWRNRMLGELAPDLFISHAENTGDIVRIGAWVIREACRQLRAWRDAGLNVPRVAVNVSYRQFLSDNLPEIVADALRDHGLEGDALELEMTERVLVEDVPDTLDIFNAIKQLGVSLVIDDFGEGYSALNYLRRLPFDGLKISHHFMQGIPVTPTDTAICEAIIRIAQSLGLLVVAEGVETETQRQFLIRQGTTLAQGYLFSKPISPEEFADFVRLHGNAG